jgi:hypothetical protein
MNDRAPHARRSRKGPGGTDFECSAASGLNWADVDRVLEVRSRLVVVADALEEGDILLAEAGVLQLLDDLDAAPEILRAA